MILPPYNPIKIQFSKYKKEFAKNISKIIQNDFTKSHEIVLIYNPIKSHLKKSKDRGVVVDSVEVKLNLKTVPVSPILTSVFSGF